MTTAIQKQIENYFVKPALRGLDQLLRPEQSRVTQYVRSDSLSRKTVLVAAPAFAALDLAYHSVALILKLLRAVVWVAATSGAKVLSIVGISRSLDAIRTQDTYDTSVRQHLLPVAAAVVALVSYPVIGLASPRRLVDFHECLGGRLNPAPPDWTKRALMAGAALSTITGLGLLAWTMRSTFAEGQLPSGSSSLFDLRDTPRAVNMRPDELNGVLVQAYTGIAFLSGLGIGYVGRVLKARGWEKTAKVCKRLNNLISGAAMVGLVGGAVYSHILDVKARAKVTEVCSEKGPDHFTCRVNQMEEWAHRIRGRPEFVAQNSGKSPPVGELTMTELADPDALKALYGNARDLTPNRPWGSGTQRAFYNELAKSPGMHLPRPDDARGMEEGAAASWMARNVVKDYVRGRGSIGAHLVAMGQNLYDYGRLHGPSYVQTMAKYCKMDLPEYFAVAIGSATRTNAKWNGHA